MQGEALDVQGLALHNLEAKVVKAYSFLRTERLKKNELIKQCLDKGVLLKTKSVNVYILKRDPGINRAAFLCRKSLYQKKLVLRNRIKRVLREAYRKNKYILPKGCDVALLAININKNTKSTIIEAEISDVFKKYSNK